MFITNNDFLIMLFTYLLLIKKKALAPKRGQALLLSQNLIVYSIMIIFLVAVNSPLVKV